MEPSLQTSFIPKQTMSPMKPVGQASHHTDEGMGLFTLLSFIILFLSLVAAGGTYAYKIYLQNILYGKCEETEQLQLNNGSLGLTEETDFKCGLYLSLVKWNDRLQDDRLVRMQRLDTKMKLATEVLNSHMSLVPLFDFLSTSTLKTVRYTKISTLNGEVNLEGTASGYEDIAVESNVLNSMPEVSGALFSDLNVDAKNNVTFKLKFQVNPGRLKYVPVAVKNATTTNQ